MALERQGDRYQYGYVDRETGQKQLTTVSFSEPDEQYLELLREALGSAFKVWLQYDHDFTGFFGRVWSLRAKWYKRCRKPKLSSEVAEC